MRLRFSKMHGLGNDFIVIDAINQSIDVSTVLSSDRIRYLADRHFGIGFDQLLLVEPAQTAQADFRYRIFNADGSEVGQCGNGARCFARFVRDQGLCGKDVISVETSSGLLRLQLDDGGLVTVDMGQPRFRPEDIPFDAEALLKPAIESSPNYYTIDIDGESHDMGVLSMGNPHAVLIVDDVMTAPVAELGPKIESHLCFPQRVNVGFLEIIDRCRVRLRVYERGAGETLACGSGACAAIVVGQKKGLLDQRVLVELAGGNLFIQWLGEGHSVLLTGPAKTVFEGEIDA